MVIEATVHQPVMIQEVLKILELRDGLIVVDGTVGGGGHSRAIIAHIMPHGRLIGCDRDPQMLARAAQVLHGYPVSLVPRSYADLDLTLSELNLGSVDRVLLDLGFSSDQLDETHRGFRFTAEGPLDLRYDPREGKPAWQWLCECNQMELQRVLEQYGEEPLAAEIAEAIIGERRHHVVKTAFALSEVITKVYQKHGRSHLLGHHPATRTFQALRIHINQELVHLERMLSRTLLSCLAPGGLVAVISFHSLEDRIVKTAFRQSTTWECLTDKPLVPSPAEIRFNPRSRSAKLRAARFRGLTPVELSRAQPPQPSTSLDHTGRFLA